MFPLRSSDRQILKDLIHILQSLGHTALHAQRLIHIVVHEVSVLVGHDPVGLPFAQEIYCLRSHNRSVNSVAAGRRSASLDIAQDRRADVNSADRLNALGHLAGISHAFGIDDDIVLLAVLTMLGNGLHDLDFIIVVSLRNDNRLRAVGNAAPERNVARIPAHDLDHTALLV